MNPIEKLRDEIRYWEEEDRKARETLAITEGHLTSMRSLLSQLENASESNEQSPVPPEAAPGPQDSPRAEDGNLAAASEPVGGSSERDPAFSGDCTEQVFQALVWKSPQSSADLKANLEKYGRGFSTGAISYGIRHLRAIGEIREAKKVGNLKYFETTPDEGADEAKEGDRQKNLTTLGGEPTSF